MSTDDFSRKIHELRIRQGLTLEQVGDYVGVGKSTVRKWETGQIANLRRDKIGKLAEALHTTPGVLMGWEDNDPAKREVPDGMLPIARNRIPLLGTIHAGEPTFAASEFEAYVEAGAAVRCDFALRVVGDSMINARIMDGDIVFIRQQDTVNDGEIAAVLIDDEATLKRVHRLPQGMLMLQAENPKYPPIYIGGDNETRNVRILGKAVAFQSDIR